MKKQIFGKMLRDVKLLGTQLSLKKGQKVELFSAENLPEKGQYFARPVKLTGHWKHTSPDDSILLSPTEFTFLGVRFF